MSLSIGIVGLPNVGKSTLFNSLLRKQVALAANYPFATIEPNVGVVPVPDDRLMNLAQIVKDEEKLDNLPPLVSALIKFIDIAGLVKGASQGEGLGNQFLSHIREVDAILQVVRVFEDENVIRSGSVSPKDDIGVINTELILADLTTVQNSKLKTQSLRQKSKEDSAKLSALEKLEEGLNAGRLGSEILLSDGGKEAIRDLQLLTTKPFLYVFNVGEKQIGADLKRFIPETGINPKETLVICAQIEAELATLSESEQTEYLKQLGVSQRGLDVVIRAGYQALGLISFLTAGPKEVRAWTIKRGSKASQAAGVIHSDFERGFIAAQVCSYEDLISLGSYQKVKEAGKLRTEGKEYVVQDGDVVEFRFSV